jgi:hypothetical protein
MLKLEIAEASISLDEEKSIHKAIDAIRNDPHAPREISVRLMLHVHNEYPKLVVVGKDKDDKPITKLAQNAEEEKALAPGLA